MASEIPDGVHSKVHSAGDSFPRELKVRRRIRGRIPEQRPGAEGPSDTLSAGCSGNTLLASRPQPSYHRRGKSNFEEKENIPRNVEDEIEEIGISSGASIRI